MKKFEQPAPAVKPEQQRAASSPPPVTLQIIEPIDKTADVDRQAFRESRGSLLMMRIVSQSSVDSAPIEPREVRDDSLDFEEVSDDFSSSH